MVGGGVPRARSYEDRLRDQSSKERDEERSQFLALVSHEMRTPLTSIISFSELLRGEAAGLSPEGLRFLGIIERNADRLLQLIDDLMMLNRVEAGGLPLQLELISLPDVVAEAVKNATPVAAKSGVTIHLDVGDGPLIEADARRLLQVLDNLIGNAVKFSHVDGLVRVRLRYARDTWRVDVSDTGIGIPADEMARLFGLFARGSNARVAGVPGSGLGLAIVKSLVEMHGGRVTVESTLGEGSTFSAFLPIHAADGKNRRSDAPMAKPAIVSARQNDDISRGDAPPRAAFGRATQRHSPENKDAPDRPDKPVE
jgi:signal transduction histidine kinase